MTAPALLPQRVTTSEPDIVPTHDLLLLSDIHLGTDIKRKTLRRAGSLEALAAIDAMDRSLAAFLDDYANRAENGRPWRLLIDGDAIDFIGIDVTPRDVGTAGSFALSPDEELYGLNPSEERCAWMMRLVLLRHPLFFRHLALFLARGNDLVIVRGNHDAALFWPAVQRTFVEGLLDAGRTAGLAAEPLAQVATSVRFEDWFYLEPGRIYVEHGHAHDEYCADPGVSATDRQRPDHLSQPVSTLVLRYFGNRFPTLDLDEVDQWTPWQFVRWAFVLENPVKVGWSFLNMLVLLLLPPLRKKLRAVRRQKSQAETDAEADEITGEIELASRARSRLHKSVQGAERFAVGVARLVRRTARIDLGQIIQMLYLDRIATMTGGLAMGVGFLQLDASWPMRLGLVGALLAGAVFIDQHLKTTRTVAMGPKLRNAADEISKLIHVPLVVMGHSHRAVDTLLADGHTRYVNLGTWMGASNTALAAQKGLPHLVVRGQDAQFLRWHPKWAATPKPSGS